jgi:hypothetical protein
LAAPRSSCLALLRALNQEDCASRKYLPGRASLFNCAGQNPEAIRLDSRAGLQPRTFSVFGGLNDDPCGDRFSKGGISCSARLSAAARSRAVSWSVPVSAAPFNSPKAPAGGALISSCSAQWGSPPVSGGQARVSSEAGRRWRASCSRQRWRTKAAANSPSNDEGSMMGSRLMRNSRQLANRSLLQNGLDHKSGGERTS